MRCAALVPLVFLLSGCCSCDLFWVDESPPTAVRVNNRTDLPIIIRYVSAGGVDYRVTIPVGGHRTFDAWPGDEAIKADYDHLIRWYDIDDDCEDTIDIRAEHFAPAMPRANG